MKTGRPTHRPSDEQRRQVKAMTAYGIGQDQICAIVGISRPTLEKHYRHELDTAVGEANSQVAQSLFQMATKGKNVAAAIFWMKTRARWKEVVHVGNEDEDKPFRIATGVNRE